MLIKDPKLLDEYLKVKQLNIETADNLFNFYIYSPIKKSKSVLDYLNQMDLFIENDGNIEVFELENDTYSENLYIKNIHPTLYKSKDYELYYDTYKPFELFSLDEIVVNKNNYYKEIYKTGYFRNNYNFLSIKKDDEVWMSLNPNEINTMAKAISLAHGNTLVLGLGLGYFAYMAINNPNVKTLTVIENDQNIIDIFNRHIFPFFNKEIKIIKDDAIKYVQEHDDYDFCFADLWHNPEDGLQLYIKLKNLEKNNKDYTYWLEPSLLALFRRCCLSLFQESINGFKDDDYSVAEYENIYDEIICKLYCKTKNIVFSNIDEIHSFLSDENILKLIKLIN